MPDTRTSRTPRTPPTPVLVLDFDGTVCLGDGLVWAYAECVMRHLPEAVSTQLQTELGAYLADHSATPHFTDGYGAVAEIAEPHIAPDVLGAAYLESRRRLTSGTVDIHAPQGLAEVLGEVGQRARIALVTNAPDIGLSAALDRLGIADAIDDVIPSAGKPAGFADIVASLSGEVDPAMVLSVGDVWDNDIAPALEIGCATGLIDRSGCDERPAHIRGSTIEELYPGIKSWSRSPSAFHAEYQPAIVSGHRTPDRSTT